VKRFVGIGLVCLPFALGAILAGVWQSGLLINPIVYMRVDLASLLLLLGMLSSGLLGVGLLGHLWHGRRAARLLTQVRQQQADSHRQFIRRLDHEIKNPLTAIRAALANLNEENGACDRATLASVRAQVDRLARLSADLRKLTDLEIQPLELEPVELRQLLPELLSLVRERADAAGCQLRLTLPEAPWPLPPVFGDRDLLFLALHNLVDNALKFSARQDTIEIRAFEDGTSVVVEVADTGPGVSEDELPHLGEELYRGSAGAGVEGSGLGLALVRAIISRHRGTMTIRSRLGQGTVVVLRFPGSTVFYGLRQPAVSPGNKSPG